MTGKTLVIISLNESSSKSSIPISGNKDGSTGAKISASKDVVISKNILISDSYSLMAKITERNITNGLSMGNGNQTIFFYYLLYLNQARIAASYTPLSSGKSINY